MIRRLPVGVEFLIVVTWAFGLEIFSSILALGGAVPDSAEKLTNDVLVSFLILKSLQFVFIMWFLRIREWSLEKFGLHFSWRATLVGVALCAIGYLLMLGGEKLVVAFLPQQVEALVARSPQPDAALSMQLLYVTVTAQGLFEELFVVGYIVTALAPVRGLWTAINVSTVVRLLYHLYEGPLGIAVQVPLGLLFAYVYARTRALWPLILADVLLSVAALALS